MFKITEYLATHGLGEYNYPMDPMQMRQDQGYLPGTDFWVVDVRDMLDEKQHMIVYKTKIIEAMHSLKRHGKIVICCGAGISRSNAIALAVLMIKTNMSYYDALKIIEEKVPIAQIEPCHLKSIRRLFGVEPPFVYQH